MPPIAEVENLAVSLPDGDGYRRRVLDGVSLTVGEGAAMGVVGESGCGKTLTALALLRLLPDAARVERGAVRLAGEDVVRASEARMGEMRGGVAGFLFQEPSRALNPVRAIGAQVSEAARLRRRLGRQGAARLAERLLCEVGLEGEARLARSYPHQLSGGERQRVLLAAALAGDPRLLIADEPTSALDTVSQRRMVELLRQLREERGLALLFITHDLALVGHVVERVTVLYAGETVETASRDELLADPRHPYSRALLEARADAGASGPFPTVPGSVSRPGEWGGGCRFAPRCPHAFDRCRIARPALSEVAPNRTVRCFLSGEREEPGD